MKLELANVAKVYREVDGYVITDFSYTFQPGSFTALMGRSGSGKSTLLNMMAGILTPSKGRVEYDGQDIFQLGDRRRFNLRATKTATVFQDYNLLPFLTAAENIRLGSEIALRGSAALDPSEALAMVGLAGMEKKLPTELSGGQCQRVAIARAVSTRPELIFADEPTGALDEYNANAVMDIFKAVAESGVTIIMVTHDPFVAAQASEVIELRNGKIHNVLARPQAEDILISLKEG